MAASTAAMAQMDATSAATTTMNAQFQSQKMITDTMNSIMQGAVDSGNKALNAASESGKAIRY
ncbi:ATP-dependent helicase HrpA [Pseudomonas borbori]